MGPLLISTVSSLVLAALVTSLVVPVVATVANAVRAVDYPGGRRRHQGAIPRLGGVAVVAGVAFGAGPVALLQWTAWGSRVDKFDLVAFCLATALIFLMGVIDDLIGVRALKKLFVQLGAAGIIVGAGWTFSKVGTPVFGDLPLGVLGPVITLLWIVGVTNAVNLIDGLDGLAGGVIAIIAASFMVYAGLQRNLFTVVMMAAIVGGCLGFLRYNWRGRIFLGDSGSLTLGFILAVTSVHSTLKSPAAVAILVPILALGVPVIDTLLVMTMRFANRRHGTLGTRLLRMIHADRNHLHHLLEHWLQDSRRAVRVIYGGVLVSCLLALSVAVTKSATAGVTIVVVECIAILLVRRLGIAARLHRPETDHHREPPAEEPVLRVVGDARPSGAGIRDERLDRQRG